MRRVLLAVFLIWSSASFVWSAAARLAHPGSGVWADAPPVLWRDGHLAVLQLEAAVAAARELIPPGAVVGFACARDGEEFYAYHWASYLLPERQVLDLRDVPDLRGVDYVLRESTAAPDPRLKLVRRLPARWMLFRVRGGSPP